MAALGRGRARPTAAGASVGLLGVGLLAAGAVAGALVAPQRVPESVASPTGEATVAVSVQAFDDPHQVPVTPTLSESVALTIGDVGRMTRTACAVGATITSGSSPWTVDDRPVVALATTLPLWRDLGVGAKGADVRALQAELARLGYQLDVDGAFGTGTAAAVNALLRQVGVDRPGGTLPIASVVWLPAPEVAVTSCDVGLGDPVAGAVATVGGALVALEVGASDSSLVAGDRVLRYGEVSAPVEADGQVTDPALLAAVAASPELVFALGPEGGGTLTLESTLAAALDVVVVPPGAIVDLAADRGCILGDGQPVHVRVVASALGQTMVETDGPAPGRVAIAPDAGICS